MNIIRSQRCLTIPCLQSSDVIFLIFNQCIRIDSSIDDSNTITYSFIVYVQKNSSVTGSTSRNFTVNETIYSFCIYICIFRIQTIVHCNNVRFSPVRLFFESVVSSIILSFIQIVLNMIERITSSSIWNILAYNIRYKCYRRQSDTRNQVNRDRLTIFSLNTGKS